MPYTGIIFRTGAVDADGPMGNALFLLFSVEAAYVRERGAYYEW